MEPKKKEHKYLPVLITVLVMLFVTAGAVAGVWYYMDQKAKHDAEHNARQVTGLQRLVDDLIKKEKLETGDTVTTNNTAVSKIAYSNDYQAVISLSTKDRALSKVGTEEIRVEAIREGWALVKFTPYPSGTTFSDGLIAKKVNDEWIIVATIDSAGNLTMKTGYKQSDIPGTIYQ